MLENRTSGRHLTFRTGRISGIDASEQIDCAVLNISPSGACILVPDGTAVAEFFNLVIDPDDAILACRRVWQRGCKIGLAFMGAPDQKFQIAR